jgi:hypothetical protein
VTLSARLRRWTPPSLRAPTPLFLESPAGSVLDEATIDEMWALRTRIFPLKPEVDPTADRAAFGQRVAMGQRTMLLRDPAGILRGTFSMHWRPSPDGSQLWLMPEYGYLDPAYRGHPALSWGVARGLLHALSVAKGRPLWFAGIGYPRSHQSLARALGPLYTLADDTLPPDAEAVLHALRTSFAGDHWCPTTHRVWLPTQPRDRRPETPSAAWLRFERICPNWQEGYGVGLAARVDHRVLWRAVREGRARRAAR